MAYVIAMRIRFLLFLPISKVIKSIHRGDGVLRPDSGIVDANSGSESSIAICRCWVVAEREDDDTLLYPIELMCKLMKVNETREDYCHGFLS